MATKVTDRDKGYRRLLKRLDKARRGAAVTVGIHGPEGGAGHSGGLTVAEVATFHEFGTGSIPARSFVRGWADEKETENEEVIRAVAEGIVKGTFTTQQGLERIGTRFVASIQARIAGGIGPALAPSTVVAKGSSVPLIDTGQLRSSITFKVE